ncbi:MAG TPA: hypothetical protein VKB55_06805 [Nocardioidaceae bacterium]|nr:hypothetical protein [Nocardioidaceae bacterium]
MSIMTRRLRSWLFAGFFFVVSGILVAMPTAAHAGLAAIPID